MQVVNDIKSEINSIYIELSEKIFSIIRNGQFILGEELSSFEKEFASYLGVKHCIGVGNGLDALKIALHCLGIGEGDEVIVPANTFIATVLAISQNDAKPVFAEPDEYYGMDAAKIESLITPRTRMILPVHLYGMPSQMDLISDICNKYDLLMVEDCAQSHGASFFGKMTGSFGNAGCFSFYPTKNLGAFGDGGCIVTNDNELADKIRIYRNYGSDRKYHNITEGVNSRLDELQAGILRIKLSHLKDMNNERRRIAGRYLEGIRNQKVMLPLIRNNTIPVWHQFVIRCDRRDELQRYLKQQEIETLIHYPIPPHIQEAYRYLGYKEGDFPITEKYADTVLSLPMYIGLGIEDQDRIIEIINHF